MITFAIVSVLESELTAVEPFGIIWCAVTVFLGTAYIIKDRRETELISELEKTKKRIEKEKDSFNDS